MGRITKEFLSGLSTQEAILEYIHKHGSARPHDLIFHLKISAQALHKHLRVLIGQKILVKKGSPPLVFYVLAPESEKPKNSLIQTLAPEIKEFIDKNYTDISPEGVMLEGVEAFAAWAHRANPTQEFDSLAREYVEIRKKADQFYNPHGFISGMEKIRKISPKTVLDEIYYFDFYSLPKFGKTRLGQIVLHSKQSQSIRMISDLAENLREKIQTLIKTFKIEALAFVPHSIPRKYPFLIIFKKYLQLNHLEIEVIKAYRGSIPVAQKSLSHLQERIQNAHETLFVLNKDHPYKRILIIDDALGSGATMNEVASKIKTSNTEFIMGLVIVGSYKGFEVIKEV